MVFFNVSNRARFDFKIPVPTLPKEISADIITDTSARVIMTADERTKLADIEPGANKYIHPNNSNTRHVTDAEKEKWNNNNAGKCIYYGGIISGSSISKYGGDITCTITKTSTGNFKITHNLGHTNYVLIPFSGSPKCSTIVQSRYANYVNIRTFTVGTTTVVDDFPEIVIISFN